MNLEEFVRNLDESGGIWRKLFRIKKEADQAGFKGMRTGRTTLVGFHSTKFAPEERTSNADAHHLTRQSIYDAICRHV